MTDISREYAEALFSLAQESGTEEAYGNALQQVLTIFRENPAYGLLMASPNIPKQERLDALQEAFQEMLPQQVMSFLLLLCERGHIGSLEKCVEEYQLLYLASQEVTTAHIISAAPLTEEEKVRLLRKLQELSKHTVQAEYSLDQSLIGGVVVHMDGTVLDGSLKQRLHDMKEVMNK